ncbi:class I SAM-dependent methyltransferase [Cytobacillus purgationiresistens]|uniref:Ubiquinone/menaquinone biosynthesis C-methylase UbiE n=1 Tax=Cytobacillus purgationiresistens TaxID=863449 RepID=A0ABU0AK74_9BACI|nr:class I SAM-dependent methyltransferase [Cytobacillus purgationiresistens]MDQ0271652.1 ubiquinone/menaquinone biosynthesis C-methylase UbiE [Cytobacillus purgationiresistens]
MNSVDHIAECMATSGDVQRVQTAHRLKLAEFWNIKEGDKILEIGCGQGDTTAVLAFLVGEMGLVHGVDIASPSYGSPLTLGESMEYLLQSRLGNQIHIDFCMDILSEKVDFMEKTFDHIVFSHCSWYLNSIDEFAAVMNKVRKWGKNLCFAEWDTRISTVEQYPHLLSVLIQAQYESFKHETDSNIRTLFTPYDIQSVVKDAGWEITKEHIIFSPDLQDAKWEVNKLATDLIDELDRIEDMPDKLRLLIHSQMSILEDFRVTNEITPLSVYAFTAE